MGDARIEGVSVRYYGELARRVEPADRERRPGGLVPRHPVRAGDAGQRARGRRRSAASRSRSRRARASAATRACSRIKLQTSAGERWVEGTVVRDEPRLVLLNGVHIEAPLDGTMLLMMNNDQPGVIGAVGTILGTPRRQHRQLRARPHRRRRRRRGRRQRRRSVRQRSAEGRARGDPGGEGRESGVGGARVYGVQGR